MLLNMIEEINQSLAVQWKEIMRLENIAIHRHSRRSSMLVITGPMFCQWNHTHCSNEGWHNGRAGILHMLIQNKINLVLDFPQFLLSPGNLSSISVALWPRNHLWTSNLTFIILFFFLGGVTFHQTSLEMCAYAWKSELCGTHTPPESY